jgi:hypothetical protein
MYANDEVLFGRDASSVQGERIGLHDEFLVKYKRTRENSAKCVVSSK